MTLMVKLLLLEIQVKFQINQTKTRISSTGTILVVLDYY